MVLGDDAERLSGGGGFRSSEGKRKKSMMTCKIFALEVMARFG